MKNFSIKTAFKKAWGIFKTNWKKLVASAFVLLVVGALLEIMDRSLEGYGISAFIIMLALMLVSVILKIGLMKMYLKAVDGEPLSLRDLFSYSKLLIKYIGASIAYGLTIFVGIVLLIIPGIYFALRFIFVPVLVIDEYVGIREAFHISTDMTKGVKWKLLGFMFVFTILNIAGAIIWSIGLLVTLPLTGVAFMEVYRKLQKPSSAIVTA